MVEITRHFDATRVNEIFNDPGVRDAFNVPSLEGQPLDFTPFINNHNNYALVGEHGCVLLRQHQPGIYECHFAVLPEERGRYTVGFGFKVFEYMFTETDCLEILTKCKVTDIASNAGARVGKFEKLFTSKPYIKDPSGLVAMNVYSLTIQHWAATAPGLEEAGERWHERIKALHEEDPVHNRYAGAALLMLYGGQPFKAVGFYNRIASLSGYQPVTILSVDPLIIDIIEAKIKVVGRDFEVIDE